MQQDQHKTTKNNHKPSKTSKLPLKIAWYNNKKAITNLQKTW